MRCSFCIHLEANALVHGIFNHVLMIYGLRSLLGRAGWIPLQPTAFIMSRYVPLMMSEPPTKTLDAIGLYCPEPVFRTKIEIEGMQVGETLAVSADDPAAEDDISRWVSRNGHEMLDIAKDGNVVTFRIRKVR